MSIQNLISEDIKKAMLAREVDSTHVEADLILKEEVLLSNA